MSSTSPVRVVVVDDNFIARLGITTFLRQQPQIQVVGEADGGLSALKLVGERDVDVVLADMKMPGFDGVALTEQLRAQHPNVKVLVLSHYEGDENIFRALRAGALGYLTKESRGEEMVTAIAAVARGERYYPASIAGRLAERTVQPSLTPRDLQVLAQIFKGLSNREIGVELSLTERSAGVYVSRLMQKLGVKSRTEAVRVAISRGILDPD